MNEDGQQERTRCIPWTERRGGRETRKSGESSLPPRWSEREIRNERGRGKGRDGGRRQVGEGEREEKRRERKARAVRSSIFWVTLARGARKRARAIRPTTSSSIDERQYPPLPERRGSVPWAERRQAGKREHRRAEKRHHHQCAITSIAKRWFARGKCAAGVAKGAT